MKYFYYFFVISFIQGIWANEVSYFVLDLDSGKTIAAKNENRPMILASTSKVFAADYILSHYSETHKFQTKVFFDEKKKDLYLVGGGDPYLTAQNLLNLIIPLKKLKNINGFFVDDSLLPTRERVSTLGLEDQADNSSYGALNIEFNRIKVHPFKKQVYPQMGMIKIEDHKNSEPGLIFKSKKNQLRESWSYNKKEKLRWNTEIPTRDSTLFTGYYFRYLASLQGIQIPKPVKKQLPRKQLQPLGVHESLTISELMKLAMEYSNNTFVEIPYELLRDQHHSIKSWLKKTYSHLTFKNTTLSTASGLSLDNSSTAREFTHYLKSIENKMYGKTSLQSLLSLGGNSGALAKRFRDPKLAMRVQGKTGSLHFVNNLVGFMTTKKGKRYAFAYFSTDPQSRKTLNLKNSHKVHEVRKKNSAWYRSSTKKMDAWIKSIL